MRSWASELDAPNITFLFSQSHPGSVLRTLGLSEPLSPSKIGLIPTCKAVVRV